MIDYDEELWLNYDEKVEKWCKNNDISILIIGDTMYIRFGDYLRYKRENGAINHEISG